MATITDIDPDLQFFNNIYDNLDGQYVSKYYDPDSLNTATKDTTNNFSLLNFNIRSFNKNFDEFESTLDTLQVLPDIIVLTPNRNVAKK